MVNPAALVQSIVHGMVTTRTIIFRLAGAE